MKPGSSGDTTARTTKRIARIADNAAARDRKLDEALAETFPASDPVSMEQPAAADMGRDPSSRDD